MNFECRGTVPLFLRIGIQRFWKPENSNFMHIFFHLQKKIYISPASVATFSTFSCNCVYVRYHTDFNHFLIAGPPKAEINSMQEKVNLGQNIKLNCPITGIPTPLYEWYKVSRLYNLNKNKRYSLIFFHVIQIIFHFYN